jgi:ubiquinone/menaquinone biosynthesis C-methylase UbiE
MTQLFDAYERNYTKAVQASIDFSGLPHSFFMAAKADLLGELIRTWFAPGQRPAALDVGCGIGTFHPYVRDLFGRSCGTDVSANCIERARRNNPGFEYKVSTGAGLPYTDAEFDLTMAICVLHHVPVADRALFVGEMRRVTRRGGMVCVIEHNPLNPLTRLSVARCEFDRNAVLLRARQTEQLLVGAELRNVMSRYFLLLPSAGPIARGVERWVASLPIGAQYVTHGQV